MARVDGGEGDHEAQLLIVQVVTLLSGSCPVGAFFICDAIIPHLRVISESRGF